MVLAQLIIVGSLLFLDMVPIAFLILALLFLQILAMFRMMKNPKKLVPWYNATGVLLYVTGMMITAMGLGFSGGT